MDQFEYALRIAGHVQDHRKWAKDHAGTDLGKHHAAQARMWERYMRKGADRFIAQGVPA
jgi:hypothetical protein